MKKIFIVSLFSFFLVGCAFIDEKKIERTDNIPLRSFLIQENKNNASDKNTGTGMHTIDGSGNIQNMSDFSRSTSEESIDPSLSEIDITDTDLAPTEIDTESTTIANTSDKDVEELINSLFGTGIQQ